MSSMPTQLAGSVLQSGVQQQAVATLQDNEHNRAAQVAREAERKAIQRENDVVADETDLTINAEHGGGGQGRSFSESQNPENTGSGPLGEERKGITTDATGKMHVDIEA